MLNLNQDLGSDNEIAALVARIQKFDFEDAAVTELATLTKALKIISDDIITRSERVRAFERELTNKLAIADIATEVSGIVKSIRPKKKSWLPWR